MIQWDNGTRTRPIFARGRKRRGAWLREIEEDREQARGLLEWVTRQIAAAEAVERLGRAWRDQATK